MATQARSLDFTNVKEGGTFRKTRQQAGDYKAVIQKVATVKKKDSKDEQWLFTIKAGAGIYPYYCGFEENVLWKIRNLFVAAGITVPKKKLKVDPGKLVGKTIAVTLEDDEYEGKKQSVINAVFPISELDTEEGSDDDDDEDDSDDSDDDTEEDSDDEEEDDEEEEPPPPPKKDKKKKKKKKPADDDLDELDIEDI